MLYLFARRSTPSDTANNRNYYKTAQQKGMDLVHYSTVAEWNKIKVLTALTA
jgi:hypothetical protein